MEIIIPAILIISLIYGIYLTIRKFRIRHREKKIDEFQFPKKISEKVLETYPHLTEPQLNKVINGLREYFHICNIAGNRMVSMPSQAVDIAWHEYILFTKQYEIFCKKSLGRFLHHTPAEAMQSKTKAQKGIKTAWKISCFRENIESKSPTRLPLLFAMDAELDIPDGFKYSLDCSKDNNYCASGIGCGSGCGGCSSGDGCGGGCGGD